MEEIGRIVAKIEACADRHGLDRKLLYAICQTESGLNPYAIRFESSYRWFYKVSELARTNRITDSTENALQSFSYGPAQVMGAVMREYGYAGPLHVIPMSWEIALEYGAMHLQKMTKRYILMNDAIASYNAGSVRKTMDGEYVNAEYVKKVRTFYDMS